jgi:hypothetical protein
MVMVDIFGVMMNIILDYLKIISNMDKERCLMLMKLFRMKDSGKIVL